MGLTLPDWQIPKQWNGWESVGYVLDKTVYYGYIEIGWASMD